MKLGVQSSILQTIYEHTIKILSKYFDYNTDFNNRNSLQVCTDPYIQKTYGYVLMSSWIRTHQWPKPIKENLLNFEVDLCLLVA